jgi:hypothetical protein
MTLVGGPVLRSPALSGAKPGAIVAMAATTRVSHSLNAGPRKAGSRQREAVA